MHDDVSAGPASTFADDTDELSLQGPCSHYAKNPNASRVPLTFVPYTFLFRSTLTLSGFAAWRPQRSSWRPSTSNSVPSPSADDT